MIRRHFLFAGAAFSLPALLAACGTVSQSKKGPVTTISVDFAKLALMADATSTAAEAVLALASTVPQVATAAPMIRGGIQAVTSSIDSLRSQGTQTFTFDSGSVPAGITSVLTAAQTLLGDLQNIDLPSKYAQQIGGVLGLAVAAVDAVSIVVSTAH